MNTTQQSLYTRNDMVLFFKFQEWLNDCPTQIEDYQDNLNHVIIRFDLPIEEEIDNNSDKVYPQVDNIPEQVYQDWLYNKEANNK